MKFSPACLFLMLATATIPSFAQERALTEYSAYYEASTNGISGNAERHLIKTGEQQYRLNISLEAKVGGIEIGDLEQASEFHWDGSVIRPTNYNYQVSGVSSDVETVSFNWEAGVALSANEDESWTLDLNGQVLDQLSYQQALANDIANGKQNNLEYHLIDGSEIESHHFRLLGTEVIETPMGSFNTLKLERVRAQDSGRSTTIWLATDWDYLLTKIEQTNSSGLQIQLQLTNALVAGKQVVALP